MANYGRAFCAVERRFTVHSDYHGVYGCVNCTTGFADESEEAAIRAQLLDSSFDNRRYLSPADDSAFYGFGGAA